MLATLGAGASVLASGAYGCVEEPADRAGSSLLESLVIEELDPYSEQDLRFQRGK